MYGSVEPACALTHNFHNVDLAALGPLSVEVFVGRHHPESGKITLACRNLKSCLKKTVFEIMLVLSVDTAGSINIFSVLSLVNRIKIKLSVLYIDVFFRVNVSLKLCVNPAGIVKLYIPVCSVKSVSVEFILPYLCISVI